ncbi:MAG TPA: hypothetical protein PKN48_09220 [Bacteroidales bacterium]|nr:hypothetical protein [Bacteroidales bacterium]
MKKFFFKSILFLSLLAFLTASNGVFFIDHYCHKSEKHSTGFVRYSGGNCCDSVDNCCAAEESHPGDVCCNKGHSEKASDVSIGNEKCCQDQHYYLKVNSSYLLPDNTSLLNYQDFLYTCEFQEKREVAPYSREFVWCTRPPPELNTRLFIKNSILRL